MYRSCIMSFCDALSSVEITNLGASWVKSCKYPGIWITFGQENNMLLVLASIIHPIMSICGRSGVCLYDGDSMSHR